MSNAVRSWQVVTAALSLALALAPACGDSDAQAPSKDAGGSGSAQSGGTGGSTATGGSGGSGGSSTMDSGTPAMSTDFTCGTRTCTTPPLTGDVSLDAGAAGTALGIDPATLAGIGVTGCCTQTNACGVENSMLFSGCRTQDMPGVPDDACPSVDFVYSTDVPFAIMLDGVLPPCCAASGECGLDLSRVSLDLGVFGPLLGVSEPLDLNIGLGCLPLTQADAIRGDSIELSRDAGTAEPIACGNQDDAGS